MSHLAAHAYGKSHIRLTRVLRWPDRHELYDWSVDIRLEGDFADTYLTGDNSRVIATDTMKNTVYVIARRYPEDSGESFALNIATHFLREYKHVESAHVSISQQPWQRLTVAGAEHPHAFIQSGTERATTWVSASRNGIEVESGMTDAVILKTTDSGFSGFIRDRYTTLKETNDRILATSLTASWRYGAIDIDWNRSRQQIRTALLETFAGHKSLSVQQTLYAMGHAALDACSFIYQIALSMPNQHRVLVDLSPFDLTNDNEVFITTSEPFGLITATLKRE